ncbi:hypothetical protein ACWERW_32720 [Streptomyces sp. NPDC004012]
MRESSRASTDSNYTSGSVSILRRALPGLLLSVMPGPGFDTRTYQSEPMKTIRPLQNGDTIDLRDRALSI